jgi:hypothetical protein
MVPLYDHEFVVSMLLALLVVWWKIAIGYDDARDIVSEEKT